MMSGPHMRCTSCPTPSAAQRQDTGVLSAVGNRCGAVRWRLGILLMVHTALLGFSALLHGPVRGEWGHLPAGIGHWQLGQFEVLAALVWSAGSSLRHDPHNLSYFNELVGGPRQGHHHLLDSNIDWGQDLLPLKRWLDRHPEVQPIAVAHSFPQWMTDAADVQFVPIRAPAGPSRDGRAPEKTGPLPGWYAIFVGQLRARHGRYEYFLHFEPVALVGYTVYIYHITVDQANRVRRELGLPDIGTEGGSRRVDGARR